MVQQKLAIWKINFTQLAKEAGRYIVKNGNDPNPGNVTEEKESELDEIVENTLMIIGTLGYRVFVPMTTKVSQDLTDNHSTYLYLKRKTKKSNKVIEATCERTTEGFVVLEGSQVEIKDSPYLPASLKEMRQNLIASRVIQDVVQTHKAMKIARHKMDSSRMLRDEKRYYQNWLAELEKELTEGV